MHGGTESVGITFDGVDGGARRPGRVDMWLFGKPEGFARRRMSVALPGA